MWSFYLYHAKRAGVILTDLPIIIANVCHNAYKRNMNRGLLPIRTKTRLKRLAITERNEVVLNALCRINSDDIADYLCRKNRFGGTYMVMRKGCAIDVALWGISHQILRDITADAVLETITANLRANGLRALNVDEESTIKFALQLNVYNIEMGNVYAN